MSVEEARTALLWQGAIGDLVDVVIDQGTESSRRFKDAYKEVESALDRLILAVKSEMPCSYAALEEERQGTKPLPGYCARFPEQACTSCAARKEMAG